jgi:hypothetical protein
LERIHFTHYEPLTGGCAAIPHFLNHRPDFRFPVCAYDDSKRLHTVLKGTLDSWKLAGRVNERTFDRHVPEAIRTKARDFFEEAFVSGLWQWAWTVHMYCPRRFTDRYQLRVWCLLHLQFVDITSQNIRMNHYHLGGQRLGNAEMIHLAMPAFGLQKLSAAQWRQWAELLERLEVEKADGFLTGCSTAMWAGVVASAWRYMRHLGEQLGLDWEREPDKVDDPDGVRRALDTVIGWCAKGLSEVKGRDTLVIDQAAKRVHLNTDEFVIDHPTVFSLFVKLVKAEGDIVPSRGKGRIDRRNRSPQLGRAGAAGWAGRLLA